MVLKFVLCVLAALPTATAQVSAVVDCTTYNVGEIVRLRVTGTSGGTVSIRYQGSSKPVVEGLKAPGDSYAAVWTVPWDAPTGRYAIDVTAGGRTFREATSFAVHRKLVEITKLELDKTFYTSGDPVDPYVVVRNRSNQALDHLRVEFEAYTFPWIAPEPDEAPQWNTTVSDPLSLAPGEEKEFHVKRAAVVQAPGHPVIISFAVVIRDNRDRDKIYDIAYAPPAFTTPPNEPEPKQYPFLYLYRTERDVSKSDTYRNFYPPDYVSGVIHFDTSHTMFRAGYPFRVPFQVSGPGEVKVRVFDGTGKVIRTESPGLRREIDFASTPQGLYTIEVALLAPGGAVTASSRLEIAVNELPKSILIFCAHEDDDTAHPGIIRAAVENEIPIHVVYFTGGDAGGCDRFYSHTCDAARALDFGEVRLGEAYASLGHLGVPRANISFLGLPDGGLGQIWYNHRSANDPYLSVLLASDHAPFRSASVPNLPFALDSVREAVEGFITKYQPEMIITGHPDERHVDHRTNNWIVVEAMQHLLRENKLSPATKLSVDTVYGASAGKHAPYRYQKQHLFVTGECARLGQEATWYYQSQDGNHQQAAIVPYAKLPREEPYPHSLILDWQEHAGWNDQLPAR